MEGCQYFKLIFALVFFIQNASAMYFMPMPMPMGYSGDPSSFSGGQKQQCVQQIVDAETLLDVISKIISDIPNICLSKFKLCGGYANPGAPGAAPGAPPSMNWMRSAAPGSGGEAPHDDHDDVMVEIVDEVVVDEYGNTTTKSYKKKDRSRRSADEAEDEAARARSGFYGYDDHRYLQPHPQPPYGGYPNYGGSYQNYGYNPYSYGGHPYGVNIYDYVQLSEPNYRVRNPLLLQAILGQKYFGTTGKSKVFVN